MLLRYLVGVGKTMLFKYAVEQTRLTKNYSRADWYFHRNIMDDDLCIYKQLWKVRMWRTERQYKDDITFIAPQLVYSIPTSGKLELVSWRVEASRRRCRRLGLSSWLRISRIMNEDDIVMGQLYIGRPLVYCQNTMYLGPGWKPGSSSEAWAWVVCFFLDSKGRNAWWLR